MKFNLIINNKEVLSKVSSEGVRAKLRGLNIRSSNAKSMIAQAVQRDNFVARMNEQDIGIHKVDETTEFPTTTILGEH